MTVRRSLALAAALAALAPFACSASNGTESKRVVGIGDSLMVLATPNIQRALTHYDEKIIARNGHRIDEMLPPLRRALRENRPVAAVIENLGTNNVIEAATYTGTLADFDRFVAITKSVPCVVLTTVSTFVDDSRGNSVGAEINAKIRELRRMNPRKYQVADWDAAVHAPGGTETLLVGSLVGNDGRYDGIHENNTAGRQWFADEYADALSRCPTGSE